MQKKILITFAIVAAIAIPIGNYTISPLFISATVNEPLPGGGKPLSGTFMGVHDVFPHHEQGIPLMTRLDHMRR